MKPIDSLKQDLTKTDSASAPLLQLLQDKIKELSDTPYLDALVLLAHITDSTKSALLSQPDPPLTEDQINHLTQALTKLDQGIPLPYIIGSWEFYKYSFRVTPEVMIPRPETEGLVERTIKWFKKNPTRNTVLELGTGSGCISISLALEDPELIITATDISDEALAIAQKNALDHNVADKIHLTQADMFLGLSQKYDLLVANLPYIPTSKLKDLKVYQTEPQLALDGGEDGLLYIKQVLEKAEDWLNPSGCILLELDEDTGPVARDLANDQFPQSEINLEQDLAGLDRYLVIQL
jgi:release factor glutamine methyltransferase